MACTGSRSSGGGRFAPKGQGGVQLSDQPSQYARLMQDDGKKVVAGKSISPWCALLFSGAFHLVLLSICATVAFAAAGCTSVAQSNTNTDSLRPCPRYNNHMPGSLQTPCREIDGKYYRTD